MADREGKDRVWLISGGLRGLLAVALLCLATPALVAAQEATGAAAGSPPGELPEKAQEAGVLGLEEAIELALKNNPSIIRGRGVVGQSKAAVAQQRAAYWPTVDGQLAYDRVRRGFVSGVSGQAIVSQYSQYTAGVNAQQIIYDFGRTSNRVGAALGQFEGNRFGLVATETDVVLNVKVAYYQVIQAKRLLAVAEASIRRLEEHLLQAQGLYDVGLRPKIDVTRAKVDLANGVAERVLQQGNLQVSKATLVNAIGVPMPLDFGIEDLAVSEYGPGKLEPLVAQALEGRPEVKQLQANITGLEAQVRAVWADYLPAITGSATYNYSGTMFPLPNNWAAGSTIDVPIFDGFLTKSQVDQAKAVLRQAQAQLEGQRQTVRLEVETAYFDVLTALEQLQAQRVAVRNAQENLELATARYRQGLGSAVEYTDAQVALTTAQAREVQALYTLMIARGRLERAVAGPRSLSASSAAAS